jgi:hypothetical protein
MDGVEQVGFAAAVVANEAIDVRRETNVSFVVVLEKQQT